MATKKAKTLIFLNTFFLLLLFEGPFISFFKDKKSKSHKIIGIKVFLLFLHNDRRMWIRIQSQKESQNNRNQGFSYYFCIMIEGSGSIPLTSGSGSGRPKNMWIRIRIRIRNTGLKHHQLRVNGGYTGKAKSSTRAWFPTVSIHRPCAKKTVHTAGRVKNRMSIFMKFQASLKFLK